MKVFENPKLVVIEEKELEDSVIEQIIEEFNESINSKLLENTIRENASIKFAKDFKTESNAEENLGTINKKDEQELVKKLILN